MNRLTKKAEEERKAFKPYESKYKTGLHIRLTEFLMLDENYLSLSNDAKVLYSYMRLWAYRSKEFRETGIVKFSISLAMKCAGYLKIRRLNVFQNLKQRNLLQGKITHGLHEKPHSGLS